MYRLPEAFYKTSASLVLGHRGTYNLLGDALDIVECLGWEIIRKSTLARCDARELKVRLVQLKEKRKAFRVQIDEELQTLKAVSCYWNCEWCAQQKKRDLNFCENLTPYLRAFKNTLGGNIKSDLLSRSGCEYTFLNARVHAGIGDWTQTCVNSAWRESWRQVAYLGMVRS